MSLLAGLVDLATRIISALGYPGVFFLMVLESMVFPVPSEAVMPFAGFLVAEGRFSSVWLVALVATIGSIVGSGLSYWIGAKWGEGFVRRYGRWFFVTQHDWDLTTRFFRKTGAWSVFLARFVPVVRHLISLPAGAAHVPRVPFYVATFAGAFAWNYFLAYVGFKLGENWERVGAWLEPFDLIVVGLLVLGAAAFVFLHVRRRHPKAFADPSAPGPRT